MPREETQVPIGRCIPVEQPESALILQKGVESAGAEDQVAEFREFWTAVAKTGYTIQLNPASERFNHVSADAKMHHAFTRIRKGIYAVCENGRGFRKPGNAESESLMPGKQKALASCSS